MTLASRHSLKFAFCTAAIAVAVVAMAAPEENADREAAANSDKADSIAEQPPVAIAVYPPALKLYGASARQPLVVQATLADGVTRDITDEVTIEISNSRIAHLDGDTLVADKDGSTELSILYRRQRESIPLVVEGAGTARPLSYRNDVIPTLSKLGCNAGACHGASRGKDGFNLSLLGYDPVGDHFRLTEQISGRRVNLALPAESLLLEKTTGKVPHTGGVSLAEGDRHYATLLEWISAGVPNDSTEAARVDKIEVFPASAVLQGDGERQRLRVLATYSDGTCRDVTRLARFETSNEFSATIDDQAVITAHGRGEAFLSVHFDVHTIGCYLIVLPAELDIEWPEVDEANYIDTLVHNKLRRLRIRPSAVSSDEEFLRRVTLDLTGRLPTPEEFEQFIADTNSDKRQALIDKLLARPEFTDIWVMKWADLLQMRTGPKIGRKSLMRYHGWLKEQVTAEVPLDQMAHDLLAANGGTFSNAATNYYQSETETLKTAENAAQVFLGMRLQCAQCHNHVFDRWTMEDYYGFAAFFAHVGRKPGEDPRETMIYNKGQGETKHPVDRRPMAPRFLGGELAEIEDEDRREVLANWVVSKNNPYFARHMANTVWAHFFGQGIVDPVDDVRISNPPVNPQLLDELARRLIEYDFQLKPLVRDICNSRTYQLSVVPNETNVADKRNFSHASLRRVPAAVMLDVISQATNTSDKFKDVPPGTRAVQIADGATTNYFMATFGRSARETVCTCETRREPNLSQALHLINGATVQHKIKQGRIIQDMRQANKSPGEIVDHLYIRCLSRLPSSAERAAIEEELSGKDRPQMVLRDVFWALLNSKEFLFNH